MNPHIQRLLLAVAMLAAAAAAGATPLSGEAKRLYDLAAQEQRLGAALNPAPEVVPTQDGRGFATKDLEVWSTHLKDRNFGVISLQWWFGGGEKAEDYYAPADIYREIDLLMRRLGIKPGDALLQGFSRGAANIYAVAALDRNRGQRYFSLYVANAGGASPDYPPTQAVYAGRFGDMPYKDSRWVTSCGSRDPNPERDGCPAMRRTGEWLKKFGASVAFVLEDIYEGHGAFHRNPQNVSMVLNWFEKNPE